MTRGKTSRKKKKFQYWNEINGTRSSTRKIMKMSMKETMKTTFGKNVTHIYSPMDVVDHLIEGSVLDRLKFLHFSKKCWKGVVIH